MANVREVFPNLERLRRVKRGTQPQRAWTKAPTFEQVAIKLAPTVLDTHVKTSNTTGAPVELRRYIFRSGNNFGYACLKPSGFPLDRCRSYDEFQRVFSNLEGSIKWETSLPRLVAWLERNCTSPAYVERVKRIRV